MGYAEQVAAACIELEKSLKLRTYHGKSLYQKQGKNNLYFKYYIDSSRILFIFLPIWDLQQDQFFQNHIPIKDHRKVWGIRNCMLKNYKIQKEIDKAKNLLPRSPDSKSSILSVQEESAQTPLEVTPKVKRVSTSSTASSSGRSSSKYVSSDVDIISAKLESLERYLRSLPGNVSKSVHSSVSAALETPNFNEDSELRRKGVILDWFVDAISKYNSPDRFIRVDLLIRFLTEDGNTMSDVRNVVHHRDSLLYNFAELRGKELVSKQKYLNLVRDSDTLKRYQISDS